MTSIPFQIFPFCKDRLFISLQLWSWDKEEGSKEKIHVSSLEILGKLQFERHYGKENIDHFLLSGQKKNAYIRLFIHGHKEAI